MANNNYRSGETLKHQIKPEIQAISENVSWPRRECARESNAYQLVLSNRHDNKYTACQSGKKPHRAPHLNSSIASRGLKRRNLVGHNENIP